jgi:spore maturation protein CgeB
VDVSFVGSLSAHHPGRQAWLEQLCREVPIQVWGQGVDSLAADSPIRKVYCGPAWGTQMYRVLACSRISVNYHIELSGSYANNMRLYETTGVGTLLVTDWKQNLHEMFEPGAEVVAYRTPQECVEKIRYLLEHEEERAQIARAGQARTLREHTYRSRMAELVALVEKLL